MTHDRPDTRWNSAVSKLVLALFLMGVGGLVNQFWNIPAQQMHQDDRLGEIEKHMEVRRPAPRQDRWSARHHGASAGRDQALAHDRRHQEAHEHE